MNGKLDPHFWDKVIPYSKAKGIGLVMQEKARRKLIYNPRDIPDATPPCQGISRAKPEQLKLFPPEFWNSENDQGADENNKPPNETNRQGSDSGTNARKQSIDIPNPIQKASLLPFALGLVLLVGTYYFTKKKQKEREVKEKLKESNKSNDGFFGDGPLNDFRKTDVGKTVFFAGEWILYLLLALVILVIFGYVIKHINKVSKDISH